jgi:hypothetical protein
MHLCGRAAGLTEFVGNFRLFSSSSWQYFVAHHHVTPYTAGVMLSQA